MGDAADRADEPTRLDRELNELLQELRVALPGVQVLFAFLLIVPFSERFDALDTLQRAAYFVAFLTTAAASGLLLAPAAYHRVQWRRRDKERLLQTSAQLAIAGLAFLAVGMAATTFVVTDVLYTRTWAAIVAAIVAALLTALWFVLPLVGRIRSAR